jgi:hypothetical protein
MGLLDRVKAAQSQAAEAAGSAGGIGSVEVTVTPTDGTPYQATVRQSFLPSQLESLSVGTTIGVKYDPDNPSSAIIQSW